MLELCEQSENKLPFNKTQLSLNINVCGWDLNSRSRACLNVGKGMCVPLLTRMRAKELGQREESTEATKARTPLHIQPVITFNC